MKNTDYFDAQMARIDATDDRAEIAAILDEVSEHFAKQANTAKRQKGSCRFAPYYKIEWLDASIAAYRPLQKQFSTLPLAQSACTKNKTWRIYEVSEESRRLVS
jgi:cell fate (sporulation/competence/biofilm development) regulator YmcA (YheA/YmcA/DUF963 family)